MDEYGPPTNWPELLIDIARPPFGLIWLIWPLL